MTGTYREKAERFADGLLDRYGELADTLQGVRDLVAMAWLEGTIEGVDETIAAIDADFAARLQA